LLPTSLEELGALEVGRQLVPPRKRALVLLRHFIGLAGVPVQVLGAQDACSDFVDGGLRGVFEIDTAGHVGDDVQHHAEAACRRLGLDLALVNKLLGENTVALNRHDRELEELRSTEDARKTTIEELEREQEELVSKTSMITGKAVLVEGSDAGDYARGLEEKVRELQEALRHGVASCNELKGEVTRLRDAAGEARRRSGALQQNYEELQRVSDERVLRSPGPSAAALG